MMTFARPLLLVGVLAVLLTGASAVQAATHRFVAMAGGEKVGHLVAEVDGATTRVDFAIDNNGRGPKARETIVVDRAGQAVEEAGRRQLLTVTNNDDLTASSDGTQCIFGFYLAGLVDQQYVKLHLAGGQELGDGERAHQHYRFQTL